MKIDLSTSERSVLKGATRVIESVLCVTLLAIVAACILLVLSGVYAVWRAAGGIVFMGGGIFMRVNHRTEIIFDRPVKPELPGFRLAK